MSTRHAACLGLVALLFGCFAPDEDETAATDESSSSAGSTDSSSTSDEGEDDVADSTEDATNEDDTTGDPACTPGIFDDSRWDEACFGD